MEEVNEEHNYLRRHGCSLQKSLVRATSVTAISPGQQNYQENQTVTEDRVANVKKGSLLAGDGLAERATLASSG